MIIHEHLKLYRRNIAAIIFITLVTSIAVTLLGAQLFEQKFKTTMFMSISVKNIVVSISEQSPYDDVQAADMFTETIQGWFKNPTFIQQIEKQAKTEVNLSANKQEKQNLVVTYTSNDAISAKNTSKAIKTVLSGEITKYNNTTETDFQIALSGTDTKEQTSKMPILITLGIILGILLGIGLSYLYELLFGFASFKYQIETLLSKTVDEEVSTRGLKINKLDYLKAITLKQNKKMLITGVSFSPTDFKKALDSKKTEISMAGFPQDADKLIDSGKTGLILLCKMGKTKLNDIKKISTLLPEKYILVVLS